MNSTTTKRNTTTTCQAGGRARRAGALSIAGALAALALTPTIAHADQSTGDGGAASARSSDIDDVVAARKEQQARDFARPGPSHSVSAVRYVFAVSRGCDIPQTLDNWSRRLIAVQVCSKAQLVPAAPARVGFLEPIPRPELGSASVGHCGHETLHQPSGVTGLPVSEWFTPTSC
ncbi:MAG: hypothetical protein ABWX84_04565 [Nocardioides sp.]